MHDHDCQSDRTAAQSIEAVSPSGRVKALTIDIHCHIATPAVEKLVAGHPDRVAEIAATQQLQGPISTEYNRTVMLPDCLKKMTTLSIRLTDMEAMGVDVQVLSPSPGQYYYWADPGLAAQIVGLANDHVANAVALHPDRFLGLATVALQHPELAAQQLEHAMRRLNLRGVEISTSAGGMELSDPGLDVFWAKAEDLGAVVFIHPLGTNIGTRLNQHYLANIIGQPIETTIALSHLIFGGVLDRRPGLKIVAAHGGGYLPSNSTRSDHAWSARPDAHSMKEPLSSYLKRIYFDNLVYTPAAMRSLLDQVGSSQVVLGTDYPFDMGSYNVRELVSQIPSLTGNEHDAILSGNALRLFGIDPLFFHRDRAE